jgi:hypothetical protein
MRHELLKWFCDTSTGTAIGAARCGFLLEGALVSWSLAMDERDGHEDLRGSDRRSVIPYVHGRMKLYCSSLPCLSLPICPPALTDHREEVSTRSFYSSRPSETRGLTGGPEVVETLYNI